MDQSNAPAARSAIPGDDGLRRCPWAVSDPLNRDYHDTEWGMPVRGESALFERLTLEAFQSGLTWITILRKRPAFRAAFLDFDVDRVASFTDRDVDRLLHDPGIVRHRKKIEATRTNARATVALRAHGGLESLVWSFAPGTTPRPRTTRDIASRSPEAEALAAALRSAGLVFVGPTTMHALMEAIGMIDTHLVDCHRRGASGLWTEAGRRRNHRQG